MGNKEFINLRDMIADEVEYPLRSRRGSVRSSWRG